MALFNHFLFVEALMAQLAYLMHQQYVLRCFDFFTGVSTSVSTGSQAKAGYQSDNNGLCHMRLMRPLPFSNGCMNSNS